MDDSTDSRRHRAYVRGVALPVALAAVLVLAGCAAPAAPGTAGGDGGTTTTVDGSGDDEDKFGPDPDRPITVKNGTLPTDANRSFARVRTLVGANVTPPDEVIVRPSKDPGGDRRLPPFWTAMGVDRSAAIVDEDERELQEGGYVTPYAVTIITGDNDTTTLRWILAHEFVHVIQLREQRFEQLRVNLSETTDGAFVRNAITEGIAVDVTDAYIRRYMETNRTNHEIYFDIRNRSTPGSVGRYTNAWYIEGWQYVDGRIDDPGQVDRIYRNPPRTSEELIHELDPGSEPVRNLSIDVTDDGTGWNAIEDDRMGEMFVRTALQNGLNASASRRAAAGWGDDELRPLIGGPNESFVWALRWDDERNATEFERLFRTYLDERGTRNDGVWVVDGRYFDVRRVSDETVVVLLGNESVVRNSTLAWEDDTVSVTVPDATAAFGGGQVASQSSRASVTGWALASSRPPSSVRVG